MSKELVDEKTLITILNLYHDLEILGIKVSDIPRVTERTPKQEAAFIHVLLKHRKAEYDAKN